MLLDNVMSKTPLPCTLLPRNRTFGFPLEQESWDSVVTHAHAYAHAYENTFSCGPGHLDTCAYSRTGAIISKYILKLLFQIYFFVYIYVYTYILYIYICIYIYVYIYTNHSQMKELKYNKSKKKQIRSPLVRRIQANDLLTAFDCAHFYGVLSCCRR